MQIPVLTQVHSLYTSVFFSYNVGQLGTLSPTDRYLNLTSLLLMAFEIVSWLYL